MKKFLILLCVCLLAACNNAQQEINNNKNNSENKEETSAITEEAPDICSLYPNSYKCKSNTSSTIAENNIVLLEQSSKQEEKQEIKTEEENTVSDEEEQLPEILKLIDEDNIDGLKKHIKQINEYVYTRTVYDDCIGGELELSITPLAYAVDKDKMEIVKFLLSKKADVNKGVYNKVVGKDFVEKESPLFIAVSNKNKEMAKLLISKGADVNFVYEDLGGDCASTDSSVLIKVIEWGDREILDLLLAKKVDLDRTIELGDESTFALQVAVDKRNIEIIKLLFEHGANPNIEDFFGNNVIDRAVYQENASIEIVKLLLDAGAKISNKDENVFSTSAIISAINSYSSDSTEILKLLLDRGADLNVKDMEGKTPIMLASENDDVEKVKLLLEAGADVNFEDENGKTALDYAKDEKIKQILLKYRAKPDSHLTYQPD